MTERCIFFNDESTSLWSDDLELFKEVKKRLTNRFKNIVIFQKKIYCFRDSFAELYIFKSSDLENIEVVERSLGTYPTHGKGVCVTFDGKSRILVFGSSIKEDDENIDKNQIFRKIFSYSIEKKEWEEHRIMIPSDLFSISLSCVFGDEIFIFSNDKILSLPVKEIIIEEDEEQEEGINWKTSEEEFEIKNCNTITQIGEGLIFLLNSSSSLKKQGDEEVEGEEEDDDGDDDDDDDDDDENDKHFKDKMNIFLFNPKTKKIVNYHGLRTKQNILDYSNETEFHLKKTWIGDLVDQEFISYVEYAVTVKRKKEQITEYSKQLRSLSQKKKKKNDFAALINKTKRRREKLLKELAIDEKKKPKLVFLKFLENLVRTFPLYVSEYEKAVKKLESDGGGGAISWMLSFFKGSSGDSGDDTETKKKKIKRAHEILYYYPVHVDHMERSFGSLGKEYKVNEYLKAVFCFFLFSSKRNYYEEEEKKEEIKEEEEDHEYRLIFQILTLEETVEEIIEKVVRTRQYNELPENYRTLFATFSRELYASDLTTNFDYDQLIFEKSYLSYFKTYKRSLTLLKPFFTTFNPSLYIEYILKFFLFSKVGIMFMEGATHIKKTESDLIEIEKKIRKNKNSLFDDFKKVFIQKQSIFEWRRIQKFTRVSRGNSKFEINYKRFVHLLGLNLPRVKNGDFKKEEALELIEYFQKIQHLREKKMMMQEIKKEQNQREFYDIINTFTPFINLLYKMCDVNHLINSWIGTVARLITIIETEKKELEKSNNNTNIAERKRKMEIELFSMFDSFAKEVYHAFKNFFKNDLENDNLIRNSTRWCKAIRDIVSSNSNIQFHEIYFLQRDERKASRLLLRSIRSGFEMLDEKNEFSFDKILPEKKE